MCCIAVHTLKSNIAFVICDWLPNSACVWKKLFPEICFVIQFVCLLISFFQAASFCILYHTDTRNVMLGNVFTEIHSVGPAFGQQAFSWQQQMWNTEHCIMSCSVSKAYLNLASELIIFCHFFKRN